MLSTQPLSWFLHPQNLHRWKGKDQSLEEPTRPVCSEFSIKSKSLWLQSGSLTTMLSPASQRELLSNKHAASRLRKNSVTAEISPFVCKLRSDILCWKNLSLPYSEGKAWLAYMLLFASQPFNHLKFSGSVHTSEICWSFFPVCLSLFPGELNFTSCAWLVKGAPYYQEIRANCWMFFAVFSFISLLL